MRLAVMVDRDPPRGVGLSELPRQLVHALAAAGPDVPAIWRALARCLTASLCDACAITFLPGPATAQPLTYHHGVPSSEVTTLPAYIARFELRGFAVVPLASSELTGTVVATRERRSSPFHTSELAQIATYIEYASLVADGALMVAAARSALHAERERTARFHEEMLGIVGHDLHSPLGAIRMSAEMLATAGTGAAHAVTRIVSFTNRMTRMLEQLLDLTRTRLGAGIPLARRSMRLLPLVTAVIEELSVTHPASQFALDGAAAVVRGSWDADRLRQVVFDVLSNAVQFGRAGAPIKVTIAQARDTALLTVHNEVREHPIAPAVLATLFEPYDRGRDREHGGNGLGLGLYIAHAIIRAHGGTLAVESSPSGTIFQVSLPNAMPA